MDAGAEGDRILGGELCGAALLFSARHGPLRLALAPRRAPPAPPATPARLEPDRYLSARRQNKEALSTSTFSVLLDVLMYDVFACCRSVCESPMGSPCPSDMYDGNLSLYEIDPHEVRSRDLDQYCKL